MPLTTNEELAAAAAVLSVAATGAVLLNASLRPESQAFGRTLVAGNDPREAALTFDDGPNDRATEAILDLLARHEVRGTFFVIGRFVRERPALVKRLHAAGHIVGNHTETHPWLNTKSGAFIREELRRCNGAIEDTLGVGVRYFRPPHGARRPAVLRAARELGLTVVQWNVMGWDWEPISPDTIYARVARGLERARLRGRGANILLHDGFDRHLGENRSATVEVTRRLLERFAHEGTHAVGIDAWG